MKQGNNEQPHTNATVDMDTQAAQSDPTFSVGDFVDVCGFTQRVESRHWDDMWETWMYTFEYEKGRSPEHLLSEPDENSRPWGDTMRHQYEPPYHG